jgi:hypothetical protein
MIISFCRCTKLNGRSPDLYIMQGRRALELPGEDQTLTKIECREDGFLNVTQLCRAGGKLFKDWTRLKSTIQLLKALADELDLPTHALVDVKRGNSTKFTQGSWIHPLLAIHLAMWISQKFAVKVSQWVFEWRDFSPTNEEEFQYQLTIIEPTECIDTREHQIRDALKRELGADAEVQTPVGFIDLLTDTKLIEIKVASDWKHAVGQLICYSEFYPDRDLWLYLFDCDLENQELIDTICSKHKIQIRRIVYTQSVE